MALPTAGTRHFVYDPSGRVMGEYGASASDVQAEFIWMLPQAGASGTFGGDDGLGGYMPLAVATPDQSATIQLNWVHGDHLGTPIIATDALGDPAATPDDYLAAAFPSQSRMFADLYYNRYRDYDPTTGRYVQADPIGLAGDLNPYLYALGNPINAIDPTGEFGLAGGIIGGGVDLTEQLISNGGRWECVNWKRVGVAVILGSLTGGFARGAFMIKRGSHTWDATRKWMGRTGFAKPGQHRHHWFFEQNSWWGNKIHNRIKNQPWNINPVSPSWHRRLHQLDPVSRTIAGAPGWAQGTAIGGGMAAFGSEGDECGCE